MRYMHIVFLLHVSICPLDGDISSIINNTSFNNFIVAKSSSSHPFLYNQ